MQKRINEFFIIWLIVFLISLCWSLSTVFGALPEDGPNMYYAGAAARLEWVNPAYSKDPKDILLSLPSGFSWIAESQSRFFFQIEKGIYPHASNIPKLKLVYRAPSGEFLSFVGRYSPIYFFVVGLPTLLSVSPLGFYASRALSALISSFLVGLSLGFVALKKRIFLFLSIIICLTPEALYYFGMVSDSSLEIASAITLISFISLYLLETEWEEKIRLLRFSLLIAMVETLSRTLSPLWVLVSLLAIVFFEGLSKVIAALSSDKFLWALATGLLATVLFMFSWTLYRGSLVYPFKARLFETFLGKAYSNYPFLERLLASLARLKIVVSGAILGFNLAETPGALIYLWIVLAVGFLSLSFLFSDRKSRYILGFYVLFAVFSGAFFEALFGDKLGYWWAGRYSLPVYGTAVVVAGLILEKNYNAPNSGRKQALVRYKQVVFKLNVVILCGLNYWAFYQYLGLTTIGPNWPALYFLKRAFWQPPFGSQIYLALYLILMIGLVLFSMRLSTQAFEDYGDSPHLIHLHKTAP